MPLRRRGSPCAARTALWTSAARCVPPASTGSGSITCSPSTPSGSTPTRARIRTPARTRIPAPTPTRARTRTRARTPSASTARRVSAAASPSPWIGPRCRRVRGRRRAAPVGRCSTREQGSTPGCRTTIVDRHVELDGHPSAITTTRIPRSIPTCSGRSTASSTPCRDTARSSPGSSARRRRMPTSWRSASRTPSASSRSRTCSAGGGGRVLSTATAPARNGGRPVDVLNLSLGYYHETPQDGLYSRDLHELLTVIRELGTVVVVSAGNDATDRPTFPASLWPWPGSDNGLRPDDFAAHISVGALNPSGGSSALFSNVGPWVRRYAKGASIVSTLPAFDGGIQASARDDEYDLHRLTIGPEDFRGGFGVWSGTSFAAPLVAGLIAARLQGLPNEEKAAEAVARADEGGDGGPRRRRGLIARSGAVGAGHAEARPTRHAVRRDLPGRRAVTARPAADQSAAISGGSPRPQAGRSACGEPGRVGADRRDARRSARSDGRGGRG